MVQGIITSVVLLKPLAPVRDIYEVNLKSYKSKDLPIWTADNVVPAAFAIGNPHIELTLHAKLTDCPRQNLTLHARFNSPDLIGSATFDLPADDSGDVVVNIKLGFVDETMKDSQAPWGISGVLKWEIQTTPDEPRVSIGETPVELYALAPTLFKAFASAGIPRKFLKLVVLPTLMHNVKTEADWINWVVNKCFRSSTQDGSVNELGDANKPIHTYRYDIYFTASSFSSAYGSDFQLDGWLSHREATDPWGVVNCYDQAGLAVVALSLGIPYKRLRWQHLTSFGYLAAEGLSLIGWGKVNTTCDWKDDPSQKMKAQNDPERKGFTNHSFASVEIDGEDMVVDACAGPVAANYTLAEYIKKAIDHSTTLGSAPDDAHRPATLQDLAKKDDNDARYGLPMSVNFPISSKVHSWDTQMWAKQFWKLISNNDPKFMNRIKDLNRIKALQPADAGTGVDLNALFAALTQEVVEKFPSKAHKHAEIHTEITETKPGPGQTHITLGPGGAQAQWTYDGVRVIIRILPSSEIAQNVLLSRLFCSSNDCSRMFKAPSDEEHKGCCHTIGVADDSIEMWNYHNFVVEVFRIRDTTSDLKVKFVADRIHSFIQPGGLAVKALDFSFTAPHIFEAPSSVEVHHEFDVKIKADRATFVMADIEGDATLILKNKVAEGGDVYKFTFVAASTGSAKVVFTAFRQETCQTMSAALTLQVN